MVGHSQCIAQFDAETQPLGSRDLLQRGDQRHRAVVLQIVLEDRGGDLDLGESQVVVQDAHHHLLAQQGRVQLDSGVQLALGEQIAPDGLDLVRWTAVHRREGDVVGQLGGDFDVGKLGVLFGQHRLEHPDLLRRVRQTVHKAGHRGTLDTLQVVSHTHIEDRAEGGRSLEPQHPPQDVDQHPGFDVLPGRFLQLEFLGPFDVVSLVGHINAWPGDLQLVHNLHRLQFDEPGARKPGRDDVLGHLGVGAGPRPDGRRQVMPKDILDRIRCVRSRGVEEGLGNPKDGPIVLQFFQHPTEQPLERLYLHHIRHRVTLLSSYSRLLLHERSPQPARCATANGPVQPAGQVRGQ